MSSVNSSCVNQRYVNQPHLRNVLNYVFEKLGLPGMQSNSALEKPDEVFLAEIKPCVMVALEAIMPVFSRCIELIGTLHQSMCELGFRAAHDALQLLECLVSLSEHFEISTDELTRVREFFAGMPFKVSDLMVYYPSSKTLGISEYLIDWEDYYNYGFCLGPAKNAILNFSRKHSQNPSCAVAEAQTPAYSPDVVEENLPKLGFPAFSVPLGGLPTAPAPPTHPFQVECSRLTGLSQHEIDVLPYTHQFMENASSAAAEAEMTASSANSPDVVDENQPRFIFPAFSIPLVGVPTVPAPLPQPFQVECSRLTGLSQHEIDVLPYTYRLSENPLCDAAEVEMTATLAGFPNAKRPKIDTEATSATPQP